MKKILVVLVLATPAAGLAQTTDTNCTPNAFGGVQCTSRHTPGIVVPWANDADAIWRDQLQAQRQFLADQEKANAARYAERRALQQTSVAEQQRLRAAQLVQAGDCEGAQRFALSAGNFTLAQQVKDYCQK